LRLLAVSQIGEGGSHAGKESQEGRLIGARGCIEEDDTTRRTQEDDATRRTEEDDATRRNEEDDTTTSRQSQPAASDT
jgi:hypothetical protein